MKSSVRNIELTPFDELLSTEKERQDIKREKVYMLSINELQEFPDHPFKVKDDEDMTKMVESVKKFGVINPILVRRNEEDGFEIVSGHRRKRACEIAGLDHIPAIVRDMTRDESIIYMVDANLQREEVLPSEKAFSYKMKLEAMNRQGERSDLTLTPVASRLRTNEVVGQSFGDSREQVRRYIRLTELIPEIRDMVDEKRIAFRPAVELSYLSREQQQALYDTMGAEDCTPSLAQAIKMKQFSQLNRLDANVIYSILQEEKPNQKMNFKIPKERLEKYWPKEFTEKQKEDLLVDLLEKWAKQRTRGVKR